MLLNDNISKDYASCTCSIISYAIVNLFLSVVINNFFFKSSYIPFETSGKN